MKNTLWSLLLIALIVAITGSACRKTPGPKSNDPFVPLDSMGTSGTGTSGTTAQSVAKLFSLLKSSPQIITVPAGVAKTVYADKGTQLSFYPNSFKDASGNIISSGDVQVSIVEMYKTGDMISNRASTTSNGELLESGGQIYISASMGGAPVFANTYGVGFAQEDSSATPMSIFVGAPSPTDTVVTWEVGDTARAGTTTTGTTVTGNPSIPASYRSRFIFDSCTSFGWVNCDRFRGYTGSWTNVRVTMPDSTYDRVNTAVFYTFPSVNGVMQATEYDKETMRFSLRSYSRVPLDIDMKVVVMSMTKDGSIRFYQDIGIIVTDTMIIDATPVSMSLDSVKLMLSEL